VPDPHPRPGATGPGPAAPVRVGPAEARTAVRTAAVWAVLRAEIEARRAGAPLAVCDAGGGTGGFAVPLAEQGHDVTVVDPSPDSLAALERRAAERGVSARVRAVQGDAAGLRDLVAPGSQDLVLCHSVLEVVDDPADALAAIAGALCPGGAASVLATNRTATAFSRALAGRPDEAARVLADPDGRSGPGDSLARRFTLPGLRGLVEAAGLAVEAVHGVRVFADHVPAAALETDPATAAAYAQLELTASEMPELVAVASQVHLLARR
jgi:S-adenosylmethionine-dependent methyltransferase